VSEMPGMSSREEMSAHPRGMRPPMASSDSASVGVGLTWVDCSHDMGWKLHGAARVTPISMSRIHNVKVLWVISEEYSEASRQSCV